MQDNQWPDHILEPCNDFSPYHEYSLEYNISKASTENSNQNQNSPMKTTEKEQENESNIYEKMNDENDNLFDLAHDFDRNSEHLEYEKCENYEEVKKCEKDSDLNKDPIQNLNLYPQNANRNTQKQAKITISTGTFIRNPSFKNRCSLNFLPTILSPSVAPSTLVPQPPPIFSPKSFPIHCNCKKSKCKKQYCECYANGKKCIGCGCIGCENTLSDLRSPKASISKNNAQINESKEIQKKCCQCTKSRCQQKYCECYKNGQKCGKQCGCVGCLNYEPRGSIILQSYYKQVNVLTGFK